MRQLYDNEIPELDLTAKISIDQVEFVFQNTRNLKDFRSYLSKTDFGRKPYEVQDKRLANLEFRLYDDKLNEVVTPLTHSLKILTNSIGLILLILGLIAYFISYLSLKASMEELWVMRSVGRRPRSIFISILVELTLPCMISSIASYFLRIPVIKSDGILPFLYFAGCYIIGSICCIGAALHRPMAGLIQEK
jgi:hypothetical protein